MNKNAKKSMTGLAHFLPVRVMLFLAIALGLSVTACSSGGSKNSSKSSSPQQNRSDYFQRRLQAEQDAEDARDRNNKIQEQTMKEEAELRRMRAERAAQRNAQREADAQQDQ